ncbi:MAG: hypothetical protein RBS16_00995 [Candidatus Cloacimonadales bacterium]|nr:hypothetical protein [Candidatus Cloacimonadota bacterium]MDD2649633.1 hypothetical protein [Candidatus Cloacimonadota bacterium]MDX9976589.1 hypothetical protein [Candidatus Cloacimonadales bacterium]
MKKAISMLSIIISIFYLFAENQITKFDGGNHQLNLSFYNSYLSGLTARSRNFGNSVSSIVIDPSLNILNPAAIGFLKESMLSLDLAPGFSFDLSNFVEDPVNEAVDEAIKDTESPNISKKYPDFELNAGQSGLLNNISVTKVGLPIGSVGFTWYRPFYLDLSFLGNSIEFVVEDSVLKDVGQESEYTEKTVLPLSVELLANSMINMQTANFSWGKQVGENVSIGAGLNLNRIDIEAGLDAKIGGFIRQYGGDTDISVTFDDPNVVYRNTMNNSIRIDFNKDIIGTNYALSWQVNPGLYLDLVLNTPKSAKLDGSLQIVQHTLGALKINYEKDGVDGIPGNEDDEEMFDVELLKPSQLAYTNRTVYVSDDIKIQIPGNLALATTYIKNDFKFIFSFEIPFGELSLDYKCERYRDGQKKNIEENTFEAYADTTSLRYKVGLKPKQNIKIAAGWKNFAFSTQLFIFDQIADGLKDKDGNFVEPAKNIIIPSIALGTGFYITKNTLMDINIVALPNPFLRTSLTWKF